MNNGRLIMMPAGLTNDKSSSALTVTGLVSLQAQLRPHAVALRSATATVSFSELNLETNRLAGYLRSKGVGPEVIVGICMDRSPSMVMAALAIMKAGGAYLPLDPSHTAARLEFMLNDAGVGLLITSASVHPQLPTGRWEIIALDGGAKLLAENGETALGSAEAEDSLAYVIYTSGSTGQPKGVQITQKSLSNLICWHVNTFSVTAADRASQLSSISFDAAVWEVWPYLAEGASVHFVEEEIRFSAEPLRDWLVSQEITISFVPTVLAEQLIRLKWPGSVALRVLLTGADTLHHYPPSDLPFTLVNNYGPTECTVVATSGAVSRNNQSEVQPTIGRPITNVQTYILDQELRQVPAGTQGELYIAGAGLARGYVRRPDLDQERFIHNPFSRDPGERLYRTGDLARYLPDGQIAFMGRSDDQIKLRGYRIEPNEIVTVLDRHPTVSRSAIVAREDARGEKNLVAYVVPALGAEVNQRELHGFLRKYLPAYMVPGVFVCLADLPMTRSGKLDRAALPEPSFDDDGLEDPAAAPRRVVEQRLAALLEVLLSVKRINPTDNFFLLGGHSLLGAQLIAQVRDAFGVELPLRSIFDFPTVSELSAKVEELIVDKINAMTRDEIEQALADSSPREFRK